MPDANSERQKQNCKASIWCIRASHNLFILRREHCNDKLTRPAGNPAGAAGAAVGNPKHCEHSKMEGSISSGPWKSFCMFQWGSQCRSATPGGNVLKLAQWFWPPKVFQDTLQLLRQLLKIQKQLKPKKEFAAWSSPTVYFGWNWWGLTFGKPMTSNSSNNTI